MYSNKETVNQLTALLVAHGIRHAVVCPGSRNAPIVHNLNECPQLECHPVTDERSAAFFALGIAQSTDSPVVVCVTSGTALLNVAPAVAEAHYQHQSLIIVSADRPAALIDQLDGQTLQQPGVLAPWVSTTVNLPEETTTPDGCVGQNADSGRQDSLFCNRLLNEALMEATSIHHPCVHINVPLSEPLFQFTVPTLPDVRVIRRFMPIVDYDCLPQPLLSDFLHAVRPLIVFGQFSSRRFFYEGFDFLFSHVIVLHESLAPFTSVSLADETLARLSSEQEQIEQLRPDFILYVGDTIVSKRLKHFLRQSTHARTWRVSLTGEVEDTFQNLCGLVVADAEPMLQSLSQKLSKEWGKGDPRRTEYRRRWLSLLGETRRQVEAFVPPFSQAAVVRQLEQQLAVASFKFEVHYANSMPVRLANRYACHPVWCNRGTNGIEGSLSTAAGFSVVCGCRTFCVMGDLSFFYDQNALWNSNIGGNLRILLLNNGHGGIFDHLRGLEKSPVSNSFVAGAHTTTAEGICRQNNIVYDRADDKSPWQQQLSRLLNDEAERPMLLEVTISPESDRLIEL